MKNIISSILLALLSFQGFINAQNFNGPESVVYDSLNNRFIVSNAGGGYISQVDENWEVTKLFNNCTTPRGLFINERKLYVAAANSILIFDIEQDSLLKKLTIEGAGLLNDLTIDDNNNLYATDTEHHNIYRLDLTTEDVKEFLDTKQNKPNGIFYDVEDKIIYVGFSKGDITLAYYDLEGNELQSKNYNAYADGVTFNKQGKLYFSDWNPAAIYQVGSDLGNELKLVLFDHEGPADINIVEVKNEEILLVPNYLKNTVDFFQINGNETELLKTIN